MGKAGSCRGAAANALPLLLPLHLPGPPTRARRAPPALDIRNQMAIIRSSEYAPARAGFEERSARQAAVLSQLAPEALMGRLAEAAAAADERSAMLASQLEAGELSVERFVEEYVRTRALYHQRDLKHQAASQTIPPQL